MNKFYISIFILFTISIVLVQAQNKISENEFNNKYANKFKLINDNIEIQTIFEFPNVKKDELYHRAKAYLDDRIQKKYVSESTNTDYSYTEYSLIVTEKKDDIIWSKFPTWYATAEYIYKLEIKDSRIRATITLFSFKQPEYNGLELVDIFPFTNKLSKKMRRILAEFIDYSEQLFIHTQNKIDYASYDSAEDDW